MQKPNTDPENLKEDEFDLYHFRPHLEYITVNGRCAYCGENVNHLNLECIHIQRNGDNYKNYIRTCPNDRCKKELNFKVYFEDY